MDEQINNTDEPQSHIFHARQKLEHSHIHAIRVLMRLAEETGLDSSLLWRAGEICRRVFRKGFAFSSTRGTDTWPDCVADNDELTTQERDIVRQADAIFHQLCTRLDLKVDEPHIEVAKEIVPDELTAPLSVRDLLIYTAIDPSDQNVERAEKRLARRRKNDESCYIDVHNRAANKPKYLYYFSIVKPILDDLKASLERPTT